jgi:hypothetical protein
MDQPPDLDERLEKAAPPLHPRDAWLSSTIAELVRSSEDAPRAKRHRLGALPIGLILGGVVIGVTTAAVGLPLTFPTDAPTFTERDFHYQFAGDKKCSFSAAIMPVAGTPNDEPHVVAAREALLNVPDPVWEPNGSFFDSLWVEVADAVGVGVNDNVNFSLAVSSYCQ